MINTLLKCIITPLALVLIVGLALGDLIALAWKHLAW